MNSSENLRPSDAPLIRSPLLIDRRSSVLLVVDVQTKLMPLISHADIVQWNIERLLIGAKVLNVRIAGSEQYPAGLGNTVEPLARHLPPVAEKRVFSCRECTDLIFGWIDDGMRQVVVVGIETHVCVLQTAMDLLSAGFDVFVPADAVGSRGDLDRDVALNRMSQSGITVTTTESVLFEWCETSSTPEFKQISQLVRQTSPV
jgi:nicotinamidase-related amidase